MIRRGVQQQSNHENDQNNTSISSNNNSYSRDINSKPNKKSNNNVGTIILFVIALFYSLYFILKFSNNKHQIEKDISEFELLTDKLKKDLRYSDNKLSLSQMEIQRTKNELRILRDKFQQSTKDDVDHDDPDDDYYKLDDDNEEKLVEEKKEAKKNKNKEKYEKSIQTLHKQITHYTSEIQATSKQQAQEMFGEEPYKVEITIEFPPETPKSLEIDPDETYKFIIELAPLSLMPHSVNLFLQQVSRKLWDGFSFHRNADHVLQAGTATYFNTPEDKDEDEMEELHLESVSFQEYSNEYPHEKYTVGFAGRPGGPDWYVSIMDNTENHGPGGQSEYEVASEADPCFGKVIKGFDVIDLMHKMPRQEDGDDDFEAMVYNVGIKRARILKTKK